MCLRVLTISFDEELGQRRRCQPHAPSSRIRLVAVSWRPPLVPPSCTTTARGHSYVYTTVPLVE